MKCLPSVDGEKDFIWNTRRSFAVWSVPSPLCQKSLFQEKACTVILTGPVGGTPLERSVPLGTSIKINLFIFDNGGQKITGSLYAIIADYAAPAMDGPAPIEAADAATVLMHGVMFTILAGRGRG